MKLTKLKPLEKNPFKSTGDEQIKLIAESIKSFEKMMSIRKIVIDENFQILGGNKRYFSLKMLGRTEIPDEWIDQRTDLTEDEKREFIVKDNTHFGSQWDWETLKEWDVPAKEWGLDLPEWWGDVVDIENVDDFNESCNFTIKCKDIEQFEQLQLKLKTSSQKINYDEFLLKVGL